MPLRGGSLPKILVLGKIKTSARGTYSSAIVTEDWKNMTVSLTLTFRMALGLAKPLHDLKAGLAFRFQ